MFIIISPPQKNRTRSTHFRITDNVLLKIYVKLCPWFHGSQTDNEIYARLALSRSGLRSFASHPSSTAESNPKSFSKFQKSIRGFANPLLIETVLLLDGILARMTYTVFQQVTLYRGRTLVKSHKVSRGWKSNPRLYFTKVMFCH